MFKMKHLWKRIFTIHTILIVISFVLVFITIYSTMSSSMREDRRFALEQQLEISSSRLDDRVEEVMQLHLQILNDSSFCRCIQSYYEPGGMTRTQKNYLDNLLTRNEDANWLVNCVYVLDRDFSLISSSRIILSQDRNIDRITASARSLAQSRGFRAFYYEDGHLLFVGAIYVDESYDYVTYLCLEISPDRMFYNFNSSTLKEFQSVYILAGDELISAAGADLGLDAGELAALSSLPSHGVYRCRSGGYSNWEILALSDESGFWRTVAQQAGNVGIILIMTLIATLVSSLLFSTQITHPLEKLTNSFRRLEQGEYPPPLEVESHDEIGQLIHSYNHVVQSLQKLNENIIAEQEEKRRIEIAAVKTRLDLLQSQIRPHFIHNTLNTLNYMAIEAGNTELSELITSFNALLRMSISNENDFCTVDSEIACIQHYMRIQRSRYSDRPLQCSYTVDDKAREALLPRLVLQPLVENALYHGILPVEDRLGVIQVRCTTDADFLCVSVSDNGVGISDEILGKINRGKLVTPGGYNHIGIQNVKERLQLMYHQACDFKIITQSGSGTTIFFRVPYRR